MKSPSQLSWWTPLPGPVLFGVMVSWIPLSVPVMTGIASGAAVLLALHLLFDRRSEAVRSTPAR